MSITISPRLVLAPTASATAPVVGDSVTFAAGVSGGRAPISYAWSFGDDTNATNATPDHAFGATGAYLVRVTVIDANGARSTANLTVTV